MARRGDSCGAATACQASSFVTRTPETGARGEVTRRLDARRQRCRDLCQTRPARQVLLRNSQGWMQRLRRQQLWPHTSAALAASAYASHKEGASVLRNASTQLLELAFAALLRYLSARDPTLRLKSKPLLDSRRQPQPYAVDVGKKQHIRLSSKTAVSGARGA